MIPSRDLTDVTLAIEETDGEYDGNCEDGEDKDNDGWW